jgi:hypothetical protein
LAAAGNLNGDRSAEEKYNQKLRLAAQIYKEQRLTIYQEETRWPEAPYWQRRHSCVSA